MAVGMNISRNQRTQRQQINPLDKATIVSVYPSPIDEVKHTIQPGKFHIDAGSESKPSLLVVGPSSWWREIDEEMPLIELPNNAIQIADSIVRDFCNGMIECNMDNAMPGLFFIPGELTIEVIKENYKTALKTAIDKQRNWFNLLVTTADKDWAKYNGNPRSISDLQRMAATELGLLDRGWMKSTVNAAQVKCVACGNLRNPEYPICPTCNRIVDLPLATKLGIVEAVKK